MGTENLVEYGMNVAVDPPVECENDLMDPSITRTENPEDEGISPSETSSNKRIRPNGYPHGDFFTVTVT